MFALISSLKQDFKVLKNAKPGHRFRDYRDFRVEQSKTEGPWRRASHLLIGVTLVLIGLAIGWLPGPGGFLSIIGVAMLLPLIPGAPPVMDRMEVLTRRSWCHLRRIVRKWLFSNRQDRLTIRRNA